MPEPEYTTHVYQYGAVPLGPFPEEGIDALYKANALWNKLVETHNEHSQLYDDARRDADEEYRIISEQLDALEEKIKKAFEAKRNARMKAGTRAADHPLIQAANKVIDDLFAERIGLRDAVKEPRKRADSLIDKQYLNKTFNKQVNLAQRVENTGGLDSSTANEVGRNFKEARSKVFKTPGSRLRFHRFDGTGFRFYRFRDRTTGVHRDGVPFSYFAPADENDDRAFLLRPSRPRGGVPRLKLRIKVAGGKTADSRVYANFDLVMHRPIPEGAQINNAKLMRRRVGDKFKYTVNFSVRVPDAKPAPVRSGAIGVDIGFRYLPDEDTIRAAMIGGTAQAFPFEEVALPKAYVDRIDYIETLQSKLDDNAAKLGKAIKPLLKAGAVLPDDHPRYRFVRSIAVAPANVTMSFEKAYKLGAWLKHEPDALPSAVVEPVMDWWDRNSRRYREMHHLRKKTLGWRKERYRILAARLVSHGLPIGVEEIDLRQFAETKDADNKLSNTARGQRFLVSNSELIGAIKNAAEREGIPFLRVSARNTSKTCSACGDVNGALKAELEWSCPSCGVVHDRDQNAAVNIARAAEENMVKLASKQVAAD